VDAVTIYSWDGFYTSPTELQADNFPWNELSFAARTCITGRLLAQYLPVALCNIG